MENRKPKIVLEHVTKEFQTKRQNILALEDINISVYEREFVSIVGPSGCPLALSSTFLLSRSSEADIMLS